MLGLQDNDEFNYTPLMWAASQGKIDVIRFLESKEGISWTSRHGRDRINAISATITLLPTPNNPDTSSMDGAPSKSNCYFITFI